MAVAQHQLQERASIEAKVRALTYLFRTRFNLTKYFLYQTHREKVSIAALTVPARSAGVFTYVATK